MKWLNINIQVPEIEQKVWYYFAVFDEIYAGKYCGGSELVQHCFSSEYGFLGDDITFWLPRQEHESIPAYPSEEQKNQDPLWSADKCIN